VKSPPHLLAAIARAGLRLPSPVLRRLTGGEVRRDGRRLDARTQAMLAVAPRFMTPMHTVTPVEARAILARSAGLVDAAPATMDAIENLRAPGPAGPVPVRIYRPRHPGRGLLVFFHGGGGVIGSVHTHDPVCRLLADLTRCRVASVEYRLAPEHAHPAAANDALAAWRWVCASAAELGADPRRIGIAGDSFGGYLAALVERACHRGAAPAPALQVLVYPLLDLTFSLPSHQTIGDGFLLDAALLHWFRGHAFPDPESYRAASPFWQDDVAAAPPTIIQTAGFDPLRDDGQRWADRLAGAGAKVDYRCADDLIHGFLSMTGAVPRARAVVAALAASIAEALA
jgi:acetyl esterase